MKGLYEIFQGVEDPRRSNATRHDLHEMLMIGLLSMLTGGRTCVDMESFGRAWEPRLREFMKLGYGIPSHDAFSDLFAALCPSGLGTALLRMAQDWGDALGEVVAVDGKALRRSFEDARRRSPLHLVQAFSAQAKLTLAQMAVGGKSNEIAALPKLLELLDVKGRVVTADAMHAQRETAAAVVARSGDYALALKGNQPTLHADVADYFDAPPKPEKIFVHQEVGKGHGRVERRTASVCHEVGWLRQRHDWPGLAAIGKVVSERHVKGKDREQTRYYLLSAPMSAERFGRVARAHWAIENSLHWVLDVTMDEDQARNRKGNGAHCLAVMRRLALNIARLHPGKMSMRSKFLHASWSYDFLLDMIRATRRQM